MKEYFDVLDENGNLTGGTHEIYNYMLYRKR